jgi:hypothetical protein
MSLIEDAIINRATNGPNVSPIISTRCYAFMLPASPTFPAMTFQRLKTDREHAMATEPGIAHAEFRLLAFDTTRGGAQTLAEAIRKDFSRWRGTVLGVVIQDTLLEDQIDGPFDSAGGSHQVMVDAVIHHQET